MADYCDAELWDVKGFLTVVFDNVRCTGSAAINMCLVASGAVDLYYEYGPHCWDVAAASLVVQEAGGFVTTTKGEAYDMMCRRHVAASSRSLIDKLVPLLTEIHYPRDDS